ERALHANGNGAPAGERAGHASGDTREAEIIAHDGDAGLAQASENGFYVLQMLGALWPVQQDIVPMGGVEILDCLQDEPFGLDSAAQGQEFFERPERGGVAGEAPAGIAAGRLAIARVMSAAFEIVDQVNDEVSGACLTGELKVFASQQVPVQAEPEFHGDGDATGPETAAAGWRSVLAARALKGRA